MTDHPIFAAFQPVTVTTSGRHVYDFTGGATRVAFKRAWAGHATGQGRSVTPALPPKNEHYLDWIVLLTAVSRAQGTFRMAECGAGWAPWLVRAALAARQRPAITALELVGIEADTTHYAWMAEHFRDNGLNPDDYHLLHGAVSATPGVLQFPVIADPDVDYGTSLGMAATAARTIDVKGWSLPETLDIFSGPLDFLHIDIQGAEYDVIPPAMDILKRRVKSVMVGTHISDAKHDSLAERFRQAGWTQTMALPRNTANATPWGEVTTNDGFLWFENPGLLADIA